ncbi:unnamed protein product [Linum trigynum]|uniref:Uncharacterized protein n=1 Tax=Linum trigynum TaxID=586398 RepID=A0AAV2EE41_9ROSI
MNGRGMNKTSRHTKTRNGPTKNQRLCGTCRSQQAVRVEQDQVGHQGGHRLVESKHSSSQLYGMIKHGWAKPRKIKTRGLFHEPNELRVPRVPPETRQTHQVHHQQPNMSSKVAKPEEQGTPCKPTKAGHVERVPSVVKLENSKSTPKESYLLKEEKHAIYGWLVWFNSWTWQWVYTFGTLVVAKGCGNQ